MSRSRALTAALFLLAAGGVPDGANAQGCLSKREGRELMVQGQVVPLPDALRQAGVSGDVVDAQLCQAGGGYVYRVRIRQDGGQLRSLNIPAG